MKKQSGFTLPKGGRHSASRPRLRTRHLSSVGKSAYGATGGGMPAFPTGPAVGPGGPAPAFQDPGAGGADSAPLTGPGGGPAGM